MEYFLIKGHFHAVGYSPDADSLMFEADNPKHWKNVQSEFSDLFATKLEEGAGAVQLRLQGIDALETHYGPDPVPTPGELRGKTFAGAEKPKPATVRQPAAYGDAATEKLLSYLGVESIHWGHAFGRRWIKELVVNKGKKKVTLSKKGEDKLPGYIVVNDFDRKGRPISWVFPGDTSDRDGAEVTTSKLKAGIKKSINYKLVANGMAYPYFFMTLAAALRQPLIYGVQNAQRQKMGLWAEDKSQSGIKLERFSQLTEEHLVFPYLFRRLVKHQFKCLMEEYWDAVARKKEYRPDPEALFLDRFFEETNPYVFLVEERDFVRLDSVVEIRDNRLRLKAHPGNIVFLS